MTNSTLNPTFAGNCSVNEYVCMYPSLHYNRQWPPGVQLSSRQ